LLQIELELLNQLKRAEAEFKEASAEQKEQAGEQYRRALDQFSQMVLDRRFPPGWSLQS
jgi:hypothetical protein